MELEPRRNTRCPQCGKAINVGGFKGQHTCGASECQEADYRANMARVKPKRRRGV